MTSTYSPTTREVMQRLFDTMVHHLLKQNKPSLRIDPFSLNPDGETLCAYRGDDGTMCAIGCLITDEHYNVMLESKAANHYMVLEAVLPSQKLPGNVYYSIALVEMLARAQRLLHDDPARYPSGEFRRHMLAGAEEIAVDFNLRMPALLP